MSPAAAMEDPWRTPARQQEAPAAGRHRLVKGRKGFFGIAAVAAGYHQRVGAHPIGQRVSFVHHHRHRRRGGAEVRRDGSANAASAKSRDHHLVHAAG